MSCCEFGPPVENRIVSASRGAEAGLSHTLSTRVWEMHPFCQMSSYSSCFLFLCVCSRGPARYGCRANLGYCNRDPNGQHLPLWHPFLFFGLWRLRGGGIGVRWVIYLLTPQAAQLSQLLPLFSSNFPSMPICFCYTPKVCPIHPRTLQVWLCAFSLSCYKVLFRGQSRFRSCFKFNAAGSKRPRQSNILSDSEEFFLQHP